MKKENVLPAMGAALWILGLILAIVGLNIRSDAGRGLAVAGNILFLVGLGIEGVVWVRKKKTEDEKTPADGKTNRKTQ